MTPIRMRTEVFLSPKPATGEASDDMDKTDIIGERRARTKWNHGAFPARSPGESGAGGSGLKPSSLRGSLMDRLSVGPGEPALRRDNHSQAEGGTLSMKRLAIAVLACALVPCAGAVARSLQDPPPGGPGGGQRRGMMTVDEQVKELDEKLQLTDEQKTKIKAILEDQRKQAGAVMQDESMSREDKMAKMRNIREATDGKIRDLLNDDQKKKFDQMLQERRDRMRQRQQGGGEPPK